MATHFGYYDDWKSAVLTCPECAWKGTFEEGAVDRARQRIFSGAVEAVK